MTRTALNRPAARRRLVHPRRLQRITRPLLRVRRPERRHRTSRMATTITAANHNRYKVKVHEANHPHAEHWIADLVDEESPTYHDVRNLLRGHPPGRRD